MSALLKVDQLIDCIDSRGLSRMDEQKEQHKRDIIDWSTREKTQKWFTDRAAGFNPACEANMAFKDTCADYADNVCTYCVYVGK